MLTRREFLKMTCALPFLDAVLSAQPTHAKAAPEPTPPEPQPWQFPLQFPAYFVKDRPTAPDRAIHKVYLPLEV